MKKLFSLIILMVAWPTLKAQDCYEDKTIEYLRHDFSEIWLHKTFQGTIGDNNQRIQVRFTAITQLNDSTYQAIGKSKVHSNICDFKGYLQLSKIKIVKAACDEPYNSYGIITATYELNEDSTQNHVGRFTGTLQSMFDKTDEGFQQFPGWYSDEGVNVFKGTWQEYGKTAPKYCSWGLQIPPCPRNDLFRHLENEFYLFNNKYINQGWHSYVLTHLNTFIVVPKSFNSNISAYPKETITFSEEEISQSQAIENEQWWNH
ncbi:hypothetical protein KDU71_19715 [Carboxylicivirga sediminis]|uniref:Uncharacterized protein n=1 Tax=Carboxylicivirga sediminis TaxID=2006564 RepID=A0A941J051_9BACT|nr:hypothetical protein [Carboxylicivirga sediminis]MBR8537809.1 hypothetical protein [Carboxylicivirga sediminis]